MLHIPGVAPTVQPHIRGRNSILRSALPQRAYRNFQAPHYGSSSSGSRLPQHQCSGTVVASSGSYGSSGTAPEKPEDLKAAVADDGDNDADYAELAADDNIILLGSVDEDDDYLDPEESCYDPVNDINICDLAAKAAAASKQGGLVLPTAMSKNEFMAAVSFSDSNLEDPCYDPVNNINVCDIASRAAAAAAASSQVGGQIITPDVMSEAAFRAAVSSSDDDDDSCYDPVLDINVCSTASQAATAAASARGAQVVSNATIEEEFRAAMAAAQQQLLSGSSDEEWHTPAQDEDKDGSMMRSGEDFWSTEKERVYLVGVTYKQQYQQQQQQQQQRSDLFGGGSNSSSSNAPRVGGGLGMAASSYSPWANDGSRSSSSNAVAYSVHESLDELGRLAETAGLKVVGSNYQALEAPNNATYIGSGKVAEVAQAVAALHVDTVIFDDELSPGQLRNLEKAFSSDKNGMKVAVADRTALILDIFSQRARTREGKLQVELAQVEYQLPRLTRMWSHLDRVSGGGQVKGTGEKQIEIDKRLLRDKAAALRRELQAVRTHRAAHRSRRQDAPIPVVALVGYTNAGKSTLLNTMTDAGVLAEDKLFATLDPTTRKVRLPGGNLEVLFSDTVGFIQKLPTQLVAAFRATLEEIAAAAVVLHVLDVSADNAPAQCAAVLQVLEELGVQDLPLITAWNKTDACADPEAVRALAASRPDTVAISGATGEGLDVLMAAIAGKLAESMVQMEVLLPYSAGALLDDVHKMGKVKATAYTEQGTHLTACVPRCLVGKLQQYSCTADEPEGVASMGSVVDDGDNGQLSNDMSEDYSFSTYDYAVDNASMEVLEQWNSSSSGVAAAAAGDHTYQPHSVGSRAGKRAEKQRRQQQHSSLASHQLPADWQDLIMSGVSSSGSSTATSTM